MAKRATPQNDDMTNLQSTERNAVAPDSRDYQHESAYCVKVKDAHKSLPPKKMCDLSRNLIVIVCEYLTFFEIVALIRTNKRLLNKLDDFFEICDNTQGSESCESVSYVKRRGTLFFQSFFF